MNLFDLAKIESRIEELEKITMQDGFWNDTKTSSVILQEMKSLKSKHTKFNSVIEELKNIEDLNELLLIEEDNELAKELLKNTKTLQEKVEKLEIETLLSR